MLMISALKTSINPLMNSVSESSNISLSVVCNVEAGNGARLFQAALRIVTMVAKK